MQSFLKGFITLASSKKRVVERQKKSVPFLKAGAYRYNNVIVIHFFRRCFFALASTDDVSYDFKSL